jgi:hypothetical protein
VKNTSGDIIKG